MKCPNCQAKLLPVDGELFCLQCGTAVLSRDELAVDKADELLIEDTTDPLLQKAITDALQHEVHFRLPVSAAPPPAQPSFASMRSVLAPPRPFMGGEAMAMTGAPLVGAGAGGVLVTAGGARAVARTPAKPTLIEPASDQEMDGRVFVVPSPKLGAASLNLLPANLAEGGQRGRRRGGLMTAWVAALAIFFAFVGVNVGLSNYYASRVYPGVKVGGVPLGGVPLSQVRARLAAGLSEPRLSVTVGAAEYPLNVADLGGLNWDAMVRQAEQAGRTTPLPVAAVLETMWSVPVPVSYRVDDAGLNKVAGEVANRVDRDSGDAVPLIVAGEAFVIADKPGSNLDRAKLVQMIRGAVGVRTTIPAPMDVVTPLITAAAYDDDIGQAEAAMALSLQVKVRTATYTPTVAQIGSWLVFQGPGKGVAVDPAAVAGYVASIPGRFDRVAAVNALVQAAQSRQNLAYTASTRLVKATPTPASGAATWPIQTYQYCLRGDGPGRLELTAAATQALTGASGWSLGGRVRFVVVDKGCNFSLELVAPAVMQRAGGGCAGALSCEAGGQLLIDQQRWAKAPAVWKDTLAAFQEQLVTHEVGHWLGFDHASCLSPGGPQPILQAPTVVLPGCSPNWYVVPPELLGTKKLASF